MPRTGLTPEELKERSIEVAEARIRRDGFERVRLVDIARDLGVSHVALYKHFPDKAALLDAVSEKWLDKVDAELLLVAKKESPIEARIREWFLTFHRLKLDKVRLDPELYRAFDFASQLMKPFVIRHLINIRHQLTDLVGEAIASGMLRQGEPEGIAMTLLEATIGYHHPKLVSERLHEDRGEKLQDILNTLFLGLKPSTSSKFF